MAGNTVVRRAIDASGKLGSFYDIHRDCVLKIDVPPETVAPMQQSSTIECEPIYTSGEKSENVLARIGVCDGLRRNILFRQSLRIGIAAVIKHYTETDKITRFIHIHYSHQEIQLSPESITRRIRERPRSLDDNEATHIITAVMYGLDIVVAFEVPSNEKDLLHKIDDALGRIGEFSKSAQGFSNWFTENAEILQQINEIKVYSNIPDSKEKTTLHDTCQCINNLRKQPDRHRPYIYTLQSLEYLCPEVFESCIRYNPIAKSYSDKLEEYLMDILECKTTLRRRLDSPGSEKLADDFTDQVRQSQKEWIILKQEGKDVIHRLLELVRKIQHCQENSSKIHELLQHNHQMVYKAKIRELAKRVLTFEDKTVSSGNRERQAFDQNTIPPREPDPNSIESIPTYEQAETTNHRKPEQQNNSKSTQTVHNEEVKIITVLLLGESGVGKSTFINAFINYLVFQTLQQAESAKPVVLIPVSFLLTTGDNFQEHTVKFGDTDTLYNEDFDHPGQSVTQQCRSYLFCVDPHKRVKFRLIDTPGFGDTRGIDQDDLNTQHILEYINQYDHFNAVCFLLKPNTSQINSFFRVCLTQLLDLLGPHIHRNIIFCFTSARSTFYTPGDTAPLLKEILQSLPTNDVPFKKKNTFCFDNESFRYLVALQNSIKFDELDRQEYELSWIKSVDESKRLFQYIDEDLSPCYRKDDYWSMRRAEIEIKSMVRPILESIRNTIRSIVLYDQSPNKSIELCPKPLARPATMCLGCKRRLVQKGQFWIVEDVLHEIYKRCYTCECSLDQHRSITYKLEYKDLDQSSGHDRSEMKDQQSELVFASAMFAYFLLNIARSVKADPFLMGLIQMIDEENICKRKKLSEMNAQVVEDLRKRLRKYEKRVEKVNLSAQELKLCHIYKRIQVIGQYDEVKVQMDCIKKTQKNLMKLSEYEVPDELTKNSFH